MSPMSPRLLRPRASGVHPEAASWRTRVVANGGTVSTTTMQAVDRFCRSIDTAGLRDRFVRLSLLCGDNLTAARVPLYVNTSASGATLGNAIDTNNSFAAGDYTVTGGIKCGSSRSLNTGLSPDSADYANGHVSVWIRRTGTLGRSGLVSTWNTGYTQPALWIEYAPATSVGLFNWYREQASGTGGTTGNHLLVTRRSTTDQAWYQNGNLGASDTNTTTTTATSSIPWHIGCRRVGTTSEAFADENVTHYSIGRSMTASQITAFYSALQTFMTALGR
jgi:hypothetical protein